MISFKLSKSSIGLMKECSRCFWLKQHKVWSRPQGIMMSLPMGMDLMLKKHFDSFRSKGLLPPELVENGDCNGVKLFDDEALLKEWRNNFKGVRVEDKEGNILSGAVDDILVKDGKLIVIDYKTRGFPLKENTADFYQDQLDTYSYLLRENGHDTENYGFLLFYYPKEVMKTGEVIFDTELVKRKIDVKNAEKMWKEALILLNGECPEKTCEWCEGR